MNRSITKISEMIKVTSKDVDHFEQSMERFDWVAVQIENAVALQIQVEPSSTKDGICETLVAETYEAAKPTADFPFVHVWFIEDIERERAALTGLAQSLDGGDGDKSEKRQRPFSEREFSALKDIVFLKGNDGSYRLQRLYKWPSPQINIRIVNDYNSSTELHETVIQDFIDELNTPHILNMAIDYQVPWNVVFVFSDDVYSAAETKYRPVFGLTFFDEGKGDAIEAFVNTQRMNNRYCFSNQVGNPDYQFFRSVVFVPTRFGVDATRQCVASEGLRSLGLVGYTADVELATRLSSVVPSNWVQELDKRYVRYLFDPNLLAGTARDQF